MASVFSTPMAARPYGKWVLFAVMGLMALAAIIADERFLIDSTDREWKHIAPFRWWLLPHGLAGAVALFLGPPQFSGRLRRARPGFHRLCGRVYVAAICIAAPLGIYITLVYEPAAFQVEIWAQGGVWLLSAVLAFVFAVKRNIPLHRHWMTRSYAFTFVFIVARLPDAFGWEWPNDRAFVEFLWTLVFLAALAPDIIWHTSELFRRRARSPVRP